MTKEGFLKTYNQSEGLRTALGVLEQTYSLHLFELGAFIKDFCDLHPESFPLFQNVPYEDIVVSNIWVGSDNNTVYFRLAHHVVGEDLEWQQHQCSFDLLFEREK